MAHDLRSRGWRSRCVSPRIARLEAAVAAGATDAISAFWREVEAVGAPLVEPIADDPEAACVTFLWRGAPAETRCVALCGFLVLGEFAENRLDHLRGTDVWHLSLRLPRATRTTYALSPNDSLIPFGDVADWGQRRATWTCDPLNARRWDVPANRLRPEFSPFSYSLLELPDAPPLRWSVRDETVPMGVVALHHVRSGVLANERRVWVYRPAASDARAELPLIVALDGWDRVHVESTPAVLDNLIAAGELPPCVALFVDCGTQAMRDRELMFSDAFVRFLCGELVPWARRRWPLTPQASRTLITGMSAAGAMAMYAGTRRPDVFGCVLAQSGAFGFASGARPPGWFPRRCAGREPLPGRVHLEAGLLEVDRLGAAEPLLFATRHLRDVLEARGGVAVSHAEPACGHDQLVFGETLAAGLRRLLG